jgi:hypothetical protein
MSRKLLVVAVLSACSTVAPNDNIAPYRSLHAWLDTWLEARRCMLQDAPDTLTGLTIGKLVDRDCRRPLHQLELQIPTDDVELNRAWRHALDHSKRALEADALEVRARGVEETDVIARALGLAVGRWIPPVERGPALPLLQSADMFGGHEVITPSFNAGFAYAFQLPPEDSNSFAFAIDRRGAKVVSEQDIVDSKRPVPLARFADRAKTSIVWTAPGSSFAYAIDVTRTGEATRTTYVPGKVYYHDRDPKTGELILYVRVGERGFIHRLEPGSARPNIEETRFWNGFDFRGTCIHGGEVWGLEQASAVHVTSSQPWTPQVGEISKEMQLDCRNRHPLLVLRHDPDVLERCDDEECTQVFASPVWQSGVAALLDDGRWAYATTLDGIVALWIEGCAKPQLFRLPADERELVAMTVDDGEPLLVFKHGRRYSSVSIPTPRLTATSTQP